MRKLKRFFRWIKENVIENPVEQTNRKITEAIMNAKNVPIEKQSKNDWFLGAHSTPTLENLRSVKKHSLKNGDIVILFHPGRLSDSAQDKLRDSFSEKINKIAKVDVLLLEEGLSIGILTKGHDNE